MQHNKDKKKLKFVHQPEYPGGPKAMNQFIYSHLKYPTLALAANVEGTVLVEYDIDYKGNVTATRVLKSVGHGCDEEACRIAKMFKFDVPQTRGLHVIFHQKVRIQFKKGVAPVAQIPAIPVLGQPQYAYTIVPSEPSNIEPTIESTPQATTFSYTITIG